VVADMNFPDLVKIYSYFYKKCDIFVLPVSFSFTSSQAFLYFNKLHNLNPVFNKLTVLFCFSDLSSLFFSYMSFKQIRCYFGHHLDNVCSFVNVIFPILFITERKTVLFDVFSNFHLLPMVVKYNVVVEKLEYLLCKLNQTLFFNTLQISYNFLICSLLPSLEKSKIFSL